MTPLSNTPSNSTSLSMIEVIWGFIVDSPWSTVPFRTNGQAEWFCNLFDDAYNKWCEYDFPVLDILAGQDETS